MGKMNGLFEDWFIRGTIGFILYLKRTTIQNSEYFTRLLFTSLNSIYSVANVLNILYIKTSKIANFSATFSMLVLFISRLKPRVRRKTI